MPPPAPTVCLSPPARPSPVAERSKVTCVSTALLLSGGIFSLEAQGGELFLLCNNGIGEGTSVPEPGTWVAAALLLFVALMHLRSRLIRPLPLRNQ